MESKHLKSTGDRIFDLINILFFVLLGIIMFYPFWYEVGVSFSSSNEVARGGAFLIPKDFTFDAYQRVLGNTYIWDAFKNSIIIVVLTTALSVFFTALMGYPLSKLHIPGVKLITSLVVFTMFFSGGTIPSYLLVKSLGWIDQYWAVVVPGIISGYNAIIMINFFKSLPAELEESAFIDGANPLRVFLALCCRFQSRKGDRSAGEELRAMSAKCPDPERLAKMLDWSCDLTPGGGGMLVTYGIEGIHYTYDHENNMVLESTLADEKARLGFSNPIRFIKVVDRRWVRPEGQAAIGMINDPANGNMIDNKFWGAVPAMQDYPDLQAKLWESYFVQHGKMSKRPNIVFYFADQQRWDTMGCYGQKLRSQLCRTTQRACQPAN